MVEWINYESDSASKAFQLSDSEWRESLRAEDYVDCVNEYIAKEQVNKYHRFTGW